MSYDLMVFDVQAVGRDEEAFWDWLEKIEEEDETSGSEMEIPPGMSANLLAFHNILRQKYPPMNGPYSDHASNETNVFATDYFYSNHSIEMGFRWDVAETARRDVIETAIRTDVGLFLNGDGEDPIFTRKGLQRLMGVI